MIKVSIIILNYNGWEDTIECLNSLKSELNQKDIFVRIIIVDNGSNNNSIEKIKAWILKSKYNYSNYKENINSLMDSKIILCNLDKNYGFPGGNNQGIKIAMALNDNYVLLLNNDTTIEKGFIKPLINVMQSDKSLGIVGGKIKDYYNHDNYILGGFINYNKCSGYHFYNTNKMNLKYVTFLSGCLWLINSKVIKKIGMLNEDYFLYVEDVEFCNRITNNGYKMTCTEDSIIYHKESKSTTFKPQIAYYNTRNRLMLAKTIKISKIRKYIFYINFFCSRLIKILLKPHFAKYYIRGFIDYYKGVYGKYE